jgi:chromosome segregation ATPase
VSPAAAREALALTPEEKGALARELSGIREELASVRTTMGHLTNQVAAVSQNQRAHERDCGKWRSKVSTRLGIYEHRLDDLADEWDEQQITGVTDVAELQEAARSERAGRKATENELERYRRRWDALKLVGKVVAGIAGTGGVGAALLELVKALP